MKKKILAVFLACVMCISAFGISAFAFTLTDDMSDDFARFITKISNYWDMCKEGEISKSEFFNKFMDTAAGELAPNICADISGTKDILKFLEKCGVDLSDTWSEFYKSHNMGGAGDGGYRDDSILDGYGALLVMEDSRKLCHFCDYIVVKNVNGDLCYDLFNRKHYVSYNNDGSIYQEDFNVANTSYMPSMYSSYSFKLYGDIRYSDGSTADDLIEPLPEKPIPNYDDDGVSEEDLEKFFDKLLDKLQLQYPDLSNLEGLLSAILAKLGTLDSDDDGQALAEINAAIITLAADNHASNQQIIAVLQELKEALKVDKDKEETEKSDLSELLKKLDGLQKSLDYLCAINTLDTGIDLWKELTDSEKSFLNEYAGIITTLINKCGLVTINNMIMNLNSVLLCTSAPSDLTADIWGTQVTILSSDMFDSEAMRYIDIAKTFVSVLLVYSFCLILRKKIAGGGN